MMLDVFALALGTGLIGVCFGYFAGILTRKFETPSVKALRDALETQDMYHKKTVAHLKSEMRIYEQPPELMQIANKNLEQGDLVSMFLQNLGGIKSIPGWLRPLIPAIQNYVKENPEKVEELMQKFMTGKYGGDHGQTKTEGDSL